MKSPELIYYVAQSLDGYITDREGSVDWLSPFEETGEDFGYYSFYDSTDSMIMGGNTYRLIQEFGEWPYPGKPSWIVSRTSTEKMDPKIHFSAQSPQKTLKQIRSLGFQRSWLVGGAGLAKSFQEIGVITEYILTIIPVLLGGGLPLLADSRLYSDLIMKQHLTYKSGVVQLIYTPKN